MSSEASERTLIEGSPPRRPPQVPREIARRTGKLHLGLADERLSAILLAPTSAGDVAREV